MAMPILLKVLTLKWNILRTIERIEVGDGSFFFSFFTLFHMSLTFFRPEVPFKIHHPVLETLKNTVPFIPQFSHFLLETSQQLIKV